MKKLRLLLINVGLRSLLYPLVSPPMGVMSLAAWLRSRLPLDIRIINQRLDNSNAHDLADAAASFDADIIGLSVMTPFARVVPDIVKGLRESGTRARIILGGPHISACGPKVLETIDADAAVAGEGEHAMEMFVQAVIDGENDLGGIPGLFWRRDGEVVVNPGHADIVKDLDDLPLPAYDLIDLPKYWRHQSTAPIPRRRYVSLVSSRGCPYGCIWCHNISGRMFRPHSPERVVEEISIFGKRYGVNDIEFLDDCFNLQRKRVLEISQRLLASGDKVRLAFPTALRTDILDVEVIDALVAAGTYYSGFSLESASERIQVMTRKRLDVQKYLDNVALFAKRRVFTNGFMMLGFPGETAEEMELTISTAAKSALHTASFFTVTPFPGTELYDMTMATHPELLAEIDYTGMDFSMVRINLSNVPSEVLFQYQRRANRLFFMNPVRIARIARDFPQPMLLPMYVPILANRIFKGLFK